MFVCKLDGVGPIDNRPSTDKLDHLVQRKKYNYNNYMWHMICDTWHFCSCDRWHVTCDMLHVTCSGGWTLSQNFSSLALTVCVSWKGAPYKHIQLKNLNALLFAGDVRTHILHWKTLNITPIAAKTSHNTKLVDFWSFLSQKLV